MRCQLRHSFGFDLFHDANGRAHVEGVNSVSLQPISVLTCASGHAEPLTWAKTSGLFGLLEPSEPLALYMLLVKPALNE
jgi:hypothetical protein